MRLLPLALAASIGLLTACGGGTDADFTDSGTTTTPGTGTGTTPIPPQTRLTPRQVKLVGPLMAGVEVRQSSAGSNNEVPAVYRYQVTKSDGSFTLAPEATNITVSIGKLHIARLPALNTIPLSKDEMSVFGHAVGGTFLMPNGDSLGSAALENRNYRQNALMLMSAMDDDADPLSGLSITTATLGQASKIKLSLDALPADLLTDPAASPELVALQNTTTVGPRRLLGAAEMLDAIFVSYFDHAVPSKFALKFTAPSFAANPGVPEEVLSVDSAGNVRFKTMGCDVRLPRFRADYSYPRFDPHLAVNFSMTAEEVVQCERLGRPYIQSMAGTWRPETDRMAIEFVVRNPVTDQRSTPGFTATRVYE